MDPGKQPLFSECGTWDANAAVSAACGAAMQPVCSLGYANPANGGIMQSMLLNTESNCFNWMTALQTAGNFAANDGSVTSLDAAMQAYCWGPGSLTDECGCLAFPLTASAWCAATSVTCPQQYAQSSMSCAALEFAQTTPAGALDVIQFTTCNPYACWLADCYAPPQDMLLTSEVLGVQSSGSCAGVCGQVVQSVSDNIAPMPPGSFSPASITANVSGIGSCGAKDKPALLVSEVVSWTWPTNGIMAAPLYITNNGDYVAQVTLSSASLDVCSVEPTNAFILPRSAQQFTLMCDQASVSAWYTASATYDPQTHPQGPPTLTINPMFEWQYQDLANNGASVTTEPMGMTVTILPASGPLVQTVTATPAWYWGVIAAIALVAVAQVALLILTKHKLMKMLGQAGVLPA